VIPEPGLSPNELGITCWVDVEVEFRTRRPDFANFLTVQLPQTDESLDDQDENEKLAAIMDTVLNEYDRTTTRPLEVLKEQDEHVDEET
jgi:hypothetical protein